MATKAEFTPPSTREAAERAASLAAPDTYIPAENYRSRGYCAGVPYQGRVRDRYERGAEVTPKEKLQTETEQAAQMWEQFESDWDKRIADSEAQKLAAQRAREARDRADEQRRQRQAAFMVQERLLASMYDNECATREEIAEVNQRVMDHNPASFGDASVHAMALTLLRAEREK